MRSNPTVPLWLLTGSMPIVCVVIGGWLFQSVSGRPSTMTVEPDTSMIQMLIVALPYAALALLAPGRLRRHPSRAPLALFVAGASGVLLSTSLWAWHYYDAYLYWTENRSGGANIGMALLLLASPLLVAGVMALAYRLSMLLTQPPATANT